MLPNPYYDLAFVPPCISWSLFITLIKTMINNSKPHHHRRRRRWWICSFSTRPFTPDNAALSRAHSVLSHSSSCDKKSEASSHTQPHQKLPIARRILSTGRISPISDHPVIPLNPPTPLSEQLLPELALPAVDSESSAGDEDDPGVGVFDVRLNLKGKNGESMVLELNSEVLTTNSAVFANLIADHRKNSDGLCKIEVPDVENLGVFRETIELMFENDIQKKFVNTGVLLAIDMLEVSAGIKFDQGVSSCLKYLGSVPWAEEEENKLTELITKLRIHDALTPGISDRLFTLNSMDSQRTLAKHLVSSIITCMDSSARNELKSLVKDILSTSSLCETDYPDLNKEDIFTTCKSCLASLSSLFKEATGNDECQKFTKMESNKTLLERISKEVDNLNWLFEILFDHQMAEDFVDLWANQKELPKMHENTSPMVRYEISRVSAMLFITMGMEKMHCSSATRLELFRAWFTPMLSDFGWLQRCRKGLDVKALEEAIGQALLTLPLKEQYTMFMDWFQFFAKHGTESPNLSKAFKIWWRRSFPNGSEAFTIECR